MAQAKEQPTVLQQNLRSEKEKEQCIRREPS